jgi:hypothetical protein
LIGDQPRKRWEYGRNEEGQRKEIEFFLSFISLIIFDHMFFDWVSFLAYLNLFEIKNFVVVVVISLIRSEV